MLALPPRDAADLAEEMPPFTGNAVEREALVEFLARQGLLGP